MADEAQDISNQEQMALVIRFVDKEKKIREEFIGFIRCDKGVRDEAGALAGSKKGVAARISKLYPWIIFVHSFSHVLNLSVMRIITVPVVRDMFDNCRVISDFFNNSPKRFKNCSEIVASVMPGETAIKLINICKTR